MPILLNGRDLSLNLKNDLRAKVDTLDFSPRLGVLLVGDDPASHLYVSLKEKAAIDVNMAVEKILLPASSTTHEVVEQIKLFNQRQDIHGILVQLPLPSQINELEVIEAIDPNKDADGFHPTNLTKLAAGIESVIPGVSSGILKLIELSKQPLDQKQALLIVNSKEFALPLKKLLSEQGVKVSVTNLVEPTATKQADIIVIALGKPNSLQSEHIKDGTILIDVGTNKVNGKIVGDIDALSLKNRQVYLSPVPGGVGPMTVIMLLWNVLYLAKRLAQDPRAVYTNK